MKIFRIFFVLTTIISLFNSCFSEDGKFDNSVKGNFDALWTILDERYCFFEYKDVDWDDVYQRYSIRIDENMGRESFFDLMDEMLAELKDGHVNLASSFNQTRYTDFYDNYPRNFYIDIIEGNNYLGKDYKIASGLKYKILIDNIGYIYYSSFNNGIGSGNLHEVIGQMMACDGIIIDVRNNGGGALSNSEKFVEPFITEKTLIGYMQHKTGKGHDEFSKPYELYVEPYQGYIFSKKVVVLTNRRTYSAANDFVSAMRHAPNVKTMGDRTGGGGGMPFTSELPNGWGIRFSASPRYDAKMENIEFGVEPDIQVQLDETLRDQGIDTIIEAARNYIKNTPGL